MGSGGGSSSPSSTSDATYPPHMQDVHKLWLSSGWDGTGTPPAHLNVNEAMYEASREFGGSPHAGVSAYDPDADLQRLDDAVDEFAGNVLALEAGADLDAAVAKAVSNFDNDIAPGSEISSRIAAFDARTKNRFQREVSSIMVGYQDIRGILTTQVGVALALAESDRRIEIDDMETKLNLFEHRERVNTILGLVQSYLQNQDKDFRFHLSAIQGIVDAVRLKIAAKQDQIEFDLEQEVRDALWDLELFSYGGNMMSSIVGAAVLPRAQTKRERLMGAITTSLSMGMQTAVSSGNVGLGLATAGIGIGAQLYGME